MQNLMIYLALVGIMFQAGCVTVVNQEETTPPFGSSVRMAVENQTVNPDAGGDEPVVGMEGKKAARVLKGYRGGATDSGKVSKGGDTK